MRGLNRRVALGEILKLASKISREELRSQVTSILEKPEITFIPVKPKVSLLESPAAPKAHHAYPGGLIDHTLAVSKIALGLIEVFKETYGAQVDSDLVLACAILHDIFKFYQYEEDPVTGGFRARSDWYIPHHFAIVAELGKRSAPERLIRCISEVHGSTPTSMIESQIVNIADGVDSKFISRIQDVIWRACRELETESNGRILADKAFPQVLRKTSILELAKIYHRRGKDVLREKIRELVEGME